MSPKSSTINLLRFIFARPYLYRMNLHLYKLSLRFIGILNSEGPKITGEDNLLKLLKKKYHPKIIFDVGANDGGYSKILRHYFPKANIYAFEPHPLTFKLLKKVGNKHNIKTLNIGLGEKNAKTKLWDFADDAILKSTQPTSTLASIYKDVIEDYYKQKSQSFSVKITTLDEFTKMNKTPNIDFLKIDTEGNEYKVLLGAKKLLSEKRIKVIQFEFNEMNVYSRTFFKDFVDLLYNYDLFRLLPNGILRLAPYRPLEQEIFAFQNIVAILKSP
jgi:FkbM family methyltransferase